MKISHRTVEDLLTMIDHSREDIEYGGGGTFALEAGSLDEKSDTKDIKKVERAIEFIKKLILERDN